MALPSTSGETEKMASNSYTMLTEFEAKYRIPESANTRESIATVIKHRCGKCDAKQTLFQYVPILNTLSNYDVRDNLPSDIISGLIVGTMMIPQSLAYGALSTLPHIVGLYLAFFSTITYFVFGTSRHLSWGCVAIISLIVADVLYTYDNSPEGIAFIKSLNISHNSRKTAHQKLPVPARIPINNGLGNVEHKLSENSSETDYDNIEMLINARRIEIVCGTSIISGLIVAVASQIGLSRISAIMSNSLITGFTVGIAFHVASSQLKEVLGITVGFYKGTGRLFRLWYDILEHLPETNYVVFLLTVISIIVMYLVKKFVNERYKHRMRVPIPIELFVVIVGILVSTYLHLNQEHRVKIVGKVPVGIPQPKLPDLSLVTNYITDAMVIVIVAHAQSLAMAKTLAMEYNYPVDSKQEMFAMGLSTVVCGLFSGFTPCASISRSLVQAGSGGKTQVASLVAAGVVLLVIMVIGPYFYYLPSCIMSAIILVNIRGMFLKLLTIPAEWRKSRHDCFVWVFACIVTVVLETGVALMLSIGFSLTLVLVRQMLSPVMEMGQIHTNKHDVEFRPLENYSPINTSEHVKFIKVKSPLYFLNSESFVNAVFETTQVNPIYIKLSGSKKRRTMPSEKTPILDEKRRIITKDRNDTFGPSLSMKTLVLDLCEVSFLDMMGVQALERVVHEFQSVGVSVLMCSISHNVFNILHNTAFWDKHQHRLFLSLNSVLKYLDNTETGTRDSKL